MLALRGRGEPIDETTLGADLQVTVHGYKAQGIWAAADQEATAADPGTVMLAAVDDDGRRIGSGFVEAGGAIRVYLSAYPPPVALTLVPLQPKADEL